MPILFAGFFSMIFYGLIENYARVGLGFIIMVVSISGWLSIEYREYKRDKKGDKPEGTIVLSENPKRTINFKRRQ